MVPQLSLGTAAGDSGPAAQWWLKGIGDVEGARKEWRPAKHEEGTKRKKAKAVPHLQEAPRLVP